MSLKQVTCDMGLRPEAGGLGVILEETRLQRVDSTSLNVYEAAPPENLRYGDELLVDSLLAKPDDTIISNGELEITLASVQQKSFLGKSGTERELYVLEHHLLGSSFTTMQGFGQTSWSGGEGEITTFTLEGAVIDGEPAGALLRNRMPFLFTGEEELVFTGNIRERRIVFRNNGGGLAIIDSVNAKNESLFYSQAVYHQGGNWVFPDTFSTGPFLVFPGDSIYLNIRLRDEGLEKTFRDTLSFYASSLKGQRLTPIHVPVKVDAVVSVKRDPTKGNESLPGSFGLRAYPNPLHGERELQVVYQLEKPEEIRIKVYDILGRHVATLLKQRASRGEHHIVWDAKNVASGVYFISAFVANHRETIQLQILR